MSKNLEEKFRSFCNSKNLEINQNQITTIQILEDFYNKNFHSSILDFFKKKNYKKGFYLHGGVGVGKTMILDFFYDLISAKKLRLHFNEFMLNFHDFVHENKNKEDENIINLFVKDLKSKALLIYFDEFQVTNIVDAMILGKLFDKIFSENIKIIVTSNIQISDLYKDGLQRDQFKPFIEIMKKKTVEHELIIEDDYRKSKENQNNRYFFPLNQESNFKMNKFFRIISKDKKKTIQNLDIKGREFMLTAWKDSIFNNLHLAFAKGDISSDSVPLVRVHAPNLIHDLIGINEFGSRLSFQAALERVSKEESGIVLLIGNQETPEQLLGNLKGSEEKWIPDTRVSGVGSQILRELGLKKIKLLAAPLKYPSLSGFDLEVVGFEK